MSSIRSGKLTTANEARELRSEIAQRGAVTTVEGTAGSNEEQTNELHEGFWGHKDVNTISTKGQRNRVWRHMVG